MNNSSLQNNSKLINSVKLQPINLNEIVSKIKTRKEAQAFSQFSSNSFFKLYF